MRERKRGVVTLLLSAAVLVPAGAIAQRSRTPEPLVIQEQGSLAAGGKVITNAGAFNHKQPTPDGQTLHGDHAYVFYQVPVNRRKLPLVFLHGTGQFSKTWETTPDGREGFQNISPPAVPGLSDRSAAPRQCRPQHGVGHGPGRPR